MGRKCLYRGGDDLMMHNSITETPANQNCNSLNNRCKYWQNKVLTIRRIK